MMSAITGILASRSATPVASIIFVSDSFTGTSSLAAHTGEVGAAWRNADWFSVEGVDAISVSAGNAKITSAFQGATVQDVLASGVPPSANYYVEATFTCTGADNVTEISLLARHTGSEFYQAVFVPADSPGNAYAVIKRQTNSPQLGYWSGAFSVAGTHVLRYEVQGSSHRLYLDSALLLDVADAQISAAGSVGFSLLNLPTGAPDIQVTSLVAGTL